MRSYCFDFVVYVTAESHSIAVIGFSAAISTSVIIVTLVSVMCVICLVLKVHRQKKMSGNLFHLNYTCVMYVYLKICSLRVLLAPFIGNKM